MLLLFLVCAFVARVACSNETAQEGVVSCTITEPCRGCNTHELVRGDGVRIAYACATAFLYHAAMWFVDDSHTSCGTTEQGVL